VKLMSNRVDTALSTSETLLEQYLPETEEVKGKGLMDHVFWYYNVLMILI